jgi:nucleotide-binding universal stress UspA family protein
VAAALHGSVSIGVVRHAQCAVMVVKGGTSRLRGALVAIDGSSHSEAAVAFLARLPLDAAVVVRLVGVVERPRFPATTQAVVAGIVREGIEKLTEERRAALDTARRRSTRAFDLHSSTARPRSTRRRPFGCSASEDVHALHV